MAKGLWLARFGLLAAPVSLPSLLSAQGFQGTITTTVEDAQVVDLKTVPGLDAVTVEPDGGLRIGPW